MKYFGTDGMRGQFGKFPITHDAFTDLAAAVELFFSGKAGGGGLKVCIGRDTRHSGIELFNGLVRGFSEKVKIYDCQVLPTPAIAETTILTGSDVGLAITASHNPFPDNGIKIFNSNGEKLTLQQEKELEAFFEGLINSKDRNPAHPTVIDYHNAAKESYCQKYQKLLPADALRGKTIILDSANGATCEEAKTIFKHFGSKVIQIGDSPSGYNINENCGSEHIQNLQKMVREEGAFIGIAYDGDGDRVVVVDEMGQKLDGDILLGALAEYLCDIGELPNKKIVATIPSNLALDLYLKQVGIEVIRCDVGDRNVYQAMVANNSFFGGENSGHLIFRKFSGIGDGITASIYILSLLLKRGINLSKLKSSIALFPQKSFNVIVGKKIPIENIGNLQGDVEEIESKLPPPKRVVLRYSGTESNKLKVFVESPDQASVDHAWGSLQRSIIENIDKNDIYSITA